MKFSKFATDKSLEIEGAWVDIGDDAHIRVARIGNDRYAKRLETLYKPYRKMQRTNSVPDDLARKLFIDALATTVLLEWKGFTNEDGSEVPYTVDTAIAKLTELKDFRELVVEIATEVATYRNEEIEEEGEILAKKSNGTSTGEADSTN
jgi:hypothetical protein